MCYFAYASVQQVGGLVWRGVASTSRRVTHPALDAFAHELPVHSLQEALRVPDTARGRRHSHRQVSGM